MSRRSVIITLLIFTARKRSLRRLCFYTCLSVHGGGGVCPIACWDTTPLGRHHPPGQTHPSARHPPFAVHAGIRSTSGRYASHWNAILFNIVVEVPSNRIRYFTTARKRCLGQGNIFTSFCDSFCSQSRCLPLGSWGDTQGGTQPTGMLSCLN